MPNPRRLPIKLISVVFVLATTLLTVRHSVIGQYDDYETINAEVKQINNDISDKQSDLKSLQDQQKKYSEAIKQKQNEKASLKNQLAILDNRVAKAEIDIELVKTDVEQTQLEIKKTNLSIGEKNAEIEREKKHIVSVLNLIHKRDNAGTLEIILLNKSLADFLSQVRYLEDINEEVGNSLNQVEKFKRQLDSEMVDLTAKKNQLVAYQADLDSKKKALEGEKETKGFVLDQVNQSEQEYQRLLAKAKREQEDAAAEIASMEKLVRAKLSELEKDKLDFNDNGFIWPVAQNSITAYFHDPDYPFRKIFEHPAVDIRAAQGSTVKAAASGYVARAKPGPNGSYAYIMLIHGDGLSTVYGHVSKLFVTEDDYVVQGQAIGLSGGLPGTPGAGGLTTGSHLHFEVRLNGIPVDPLSYLP